MDRTREYGSRDDGDFSWTATAFLPSILLFAHRRFTDHLLAEAFPKTFAKTPLCPEFYARVAVLATRAGI